MFKHRAFGLIALVAALAILTTCGGVAGDSRRGDGGGGDTGGGGGSVQAVNHVIILMQENRSFDSYFGQMTEYRRRNNIPINSSDGRIRDFSEGNFTNISPADNQPIAPYHTGSVCTENLSPDWSESHKMFNVATPGSTEYRMDGFVDVAYGLSQAFNLVDQSGRRAMGYFTDAELNYYYFMASQFAMSDMMFSPVPSNTPPNRLYMHAATSQGHAHTPATQISAKTIWQALDEKGVSWKIYITDTETNFTFLEFFTYFNNPTVQSKIVPLSQYFDDVKNGTLPAVAFIETGMNSGLDEHPSNVNPATGQVHQINIQNGAEYAATLINALMNSVSWKDSVFFWIFDEAGGPFDHVPPANVPNPDGIAPQDLLPEKDPARDFDHTGMRIPNFIVSPFARKNYVSHTPMDFTAILKFIETRWDIPPLTRRDASMPDMLEFFDFRNGGPWATPPTPPVQVKNGACDFSRQ